jgi:L-2,4-diaminobutyrate transaminase
MDKSARNYPLEDIDRETMFHPNTSIVDHLKKGPHIMAKARGEWAGTVLPFLRR